MGLLVRGDNHVIRGLESEMITNGQWFNQSCLHDEASTKTQQGRVWSFF